MPLSSCVTRRAAWRTRRVWSWRVACRCEPCAGQSGDARLAPAARARSYGITDACELEDAVTQSRRLLAGFRRHPLYREMDGAERRLHEVPYSLIREGEVESGIIDALYRADGGWTIVEFKTDRVQDQAGAERLLAEIDYAAQVARYVTAVEQLLGERPGCVLCWLNWAGGVRVSR